MFSRCLSGLALAILLTTGAADGRELRVCADPNNLPFSNEQEEGLENRIVEIVADELHATISYVWWAQRRGFVTNALNAGLCDLIPGVARIDGVLTTWPALYRSSYVFVTRPGEPIVSSLDDPRLRTIIVGVQLVGDEGGSTPPAAALAERGVIDNVRGYPILGDYGSSNQPAAIMEAVATGEIDVALVWGPLAGYFAANAEPQLAVTPIDDPYRDLELPMAFDIAMGFRMDEGALRKDVEEALVARRDEIDSVLRAYHLPRLDRP
jgi:mxaJ protein